MNKFFLIGMPAAGKTTAGKFISKNTNLKLFDLDIEIEKYYGKEIKDIFKEYGEEHFRKIEPTFWDLTWNYEKIKVAPRNSVQNPGPN